ncbi:MAG: sulfite exporter TauE/SafE family protein [Eubacteriales bacterium]
MSKSTINVYGMSCGSCAMTIESRLKGMDGIYKADVSFQKGIADIEYDINKLKEDEIKHVIENLGYKVEENNAAHKSNEGNYKVIIGLLVVGFAIYILLKKTIGFNYIPEVSQSMGYGILFVVGLLTSIHCVAMCGGINLSQSIVKDTDKEMTLSKKMTPSLYYNLGRVVSYTIIGGFAGALGSVISFSGAAKGTVSIIAGVFMLLMGINMLNIFPALRKLIPSMPKFMAVKINNAKIGRGPFIVGLLNGFMPCGPLQTMQIYALGTGSFLSGAFSMFMFSIGTVPLMFAFGALSSVLSNTFTKKLMKASAVLVIFLGVVMFGRGLNQFGVNTALAIKSEENVAQMQGEYQIVTTEMEPNFYEPFAVLAGVPVVWTINVEEGDLNGCNNPITIPEYGIEKELVIGKNVIEFIPEKEGKILYTCWMGMISGYVNVTEEIENFVN